VEPSHELIALLHQIRGGVSPVERLRLTALAWRTLRGLSRSERMAVAKAVGLEGAEKIIETLGDRGGLSPARVLEAIRRLEAADPDEVSSMVRQLADPEHRGEALEEIVDEVVDLVEAPDTPTAAITEPPPRLPPEPPPQVVPGGEDVKPAPAMDPSPSADPAPETAARAPIEALVTSVAPVSVPPFLVASEPTMAAESTARTPRPAPTAARSTDRPRGTARLARRPAVPEDRASAALRDRLADAANAFQRLRVLAVEPDRGRPLSGAHLTEVAALLPAGWMRRRAIEHLIRAGAVANAQDALQALGSDDRTQQWWVLTALARWGDDEAAASVLDTAPGDMLQWRLQHRLARR
jgi:hypothetical protein